MQLKSTMENLSGWLRELRTIRIFVFGLLIRSVQIPRCPGIDSGDYGQNRRDWTMDDSMSDKVSYALAIAAEFSRCPGMQCKPSGRRSRTLIDSPHRP